MHNRKALLKRFQYLWIGELFSSLFLPTLTILVTRYVESRLGFFLVYSMVITTLILWQGSRYWWLKLKAFQARSEMATKHLRWFRVFRTVNWVLIGALPVILVFRRLLGYDTITLLNTLYGLGFYTLAVLEQINYYYYQLMYDTPGSWKTLRSTMKLKRSRLYRDLQRLQKNC